MSASIAALRSIIFDEAAPPRRKVEACEAILAYESPTEAADEAKGVLTQIFEDADHHEDIRIDALKVMRKAEARRVTQASMPPEDRTKWREQWIRRIAGDRRAKLQAAGIWPAPEGWMSDLLDPNWEPPAGPGYGPVDPVGFGDKLQAARMKLKNGG